MNDQEVEEYTWQCIKDELIDEILLTLPYDPSFDDAGPEMQKWMIRRAVSQYFYKLRELI